MSSRLFQEVREKRGLCYSVYSFHWAFADSGVFGVAAATGADEVAELVPVVLDELQARDPDHHRRRSDPRPQSDPRRAADVAGKPFGRAGQLARQQILWGRPIPMPETVDRINRITGQPGAGGRGTDFHPGSADLGRHRAYRQASRRGRDRRLSSAIGMATHPLALSSPAAR